MTEFRKFFGVDREKTNYRTEESGTGSRVRDGDIPYAFGSRTKEQKARDRQTYTDHKKTIRVSNLIDGLEENDLRDLFGNYGRVRRVKIVRTMERGEWVDTGAAFVTFNSEDEAADAVAGCDGILWMHTRIRVTVSRPPKRARRNY